MATLGTGTYDNLIQGEIVTDSGVLISGQNLTRGALLGKITASGKLTLSLSTATDGSEVPYAVLNGDVDASAGDKNAPIILSGELTGSSLIYGASHTEASVKDGLRDLGIFLKTIG